MTAHSHQEHASLPPFLIRDCVLIAIATGAKAWTLKELRQELAQTPPGSLYFHFWGGLLQPRFEEFEYNNDFAAWVWHGLHDHELAERLALVDPIEFDDLEGIRRELLELIEQRLDESEGLQWQPAQQAFEFVQSQIIVFDTRFRADTPQALAALLPRLSTSAIFYHFIDARRRSPNSQDDFSSWLGFFDGRYAELIRELAGIDPYFGSLVELRTTVAEAFAHHFPEAHR